MSNTNLLNPADYSDELKPCVKKPLTVHAAQLSEECEIKTLEGIMHGKAGDYLMRGIEGEFYICDRKIWEKTYEWGSSTDVTYEELIKQYISDEWELLELPPFTIEYHGDIDSTSINYTVRDSVSYMYGQGDTIYSALKSYWKSLTEFYELNERHCQTHTGNMVMLRVLQKYLRKIPKTPEGTE